MASDYKTAKESWVSDLTGSTVIHINFVSAVALYSILLYSSIVSRVPPSRSKKFLVQWIILVFPLLLSMTVYANMPAFLCFVLLIPASIAPFFPRQYVSTPLPSQNPMPSSPQSPQISPLPAVTIYRAHMMLMTILGILAVDFPVFPRALAKCETFGVSLMDLGVGSFVFSQGLVSAAPLLKNPSHLSAPAVPKILTITRKSLPIIFLGVVRVLLVKGTSYPEHVSEYGTHWNFFITLALLPILQVVLHPVVKHVSVALLGVLVAFAHQLTLSYLGMHQFVLHAPRVGIISANKEGLVSLAGYLGLHLLGLSTGTIILPPSSKYFSRELRKLGHSRRNSDAQYIANALSAPREINH
ncbi:GPI-anchored wall transfer protein 1, partial [Termitomyces sp. T112]